MPFLAFKRIKIQKRHTRQKDTWRKIFFKRLAARNFYLMKKSNECEKSVRHADQSNEMIRTAADRGAGLV